MSSAFRIQIGKPAPLGATCTPEGVNFSVFSPQALGLDLLLYDSPEAPLPSTSIALDPDLHRTGDCWHVFVEQCRHGALYAWRARGPHQPEQGLLFDGNKVLLDPYARAVSGELYSRKAAAARGDNGPCALRGVVIDPELYDWEGDRPLPPISGREYLYEMHLSGFTRSPSSGLADEERGTYAGLQKRIDHLKNLGITTVELMPVFHFDTQDAPPGRRNVWGYSTIGFFAPHAAFASGPHPGAAVDEFRNMVKALHQAGLRVVLDVVFNHTAEGGIKGPTLSWRGLANEIYYLRDPETGTYLDFTGCGNTLNANHPMVTRYILDSLRYWVEHMHVDGFRFDLASALTRDSEGKPLEKPPLLQALEADPVLASVSMTAEAWDTGGLYQVGTFPGKNFSQWNGPFRDQVRGFWRGDAGTIENLMARLVGSPDLFSQSNLAARAPVNFVTCHDGFSLSDLVAYSRKHNLANGEENRDGSDHNISCNHGVEGPTKDPKILNIRQRQIRNFLATLFLAHGTPLLTMGDELGHTRLGNNNPWCQDNELNWLNWDQLLANQDLFRFTRDLIAFTKSVDLLQSPAFWTVTSPENKGQLTWHGVKLNQPDWSPESRLLAFTLGPSEEDQILHTMLNATGRDRVFKLPVNRPGWHWLKILDTAAPAPDDLVLPDADPPTLAGSVKVAARSMVLVQESSSKRQ